MNTIIILTTVFFAIALLMYSKIRKQDVEIKHLKMDRDKYKNLWSNRIK